MTELSPRVAAFLEFATTNTYSPDEERVALATSRELADNGVASVASIAARAERTVDGVEGDKLRVQFDKAGTKHIVARFLVAAERADDVPF